MPSLPAEAAEQLAPRFQKPGLKDPKLLIGLLLIVLSVIAVISVVRLGNKTEPYYLATRDIAVGEEIHMQDLTVADVRLAESREHYISQQKGIAEGTIATSRIASGQLIPASSISSENTDGRRIATVSIESTYAATLTPGKHVDVWISTKGQGGANSYNDPEVVMEAAEVSTISSKETLIGGSGKSVVQILVNDDALAKILKALNNEEKINLVPSDYSSRG